MNDRCRSTQFGAIWRKLVRSLQNLEFAEGTSAPDKKAGWDHFPDSLGYACLALRHGLLPYSLGPGPRFS